MASIEFGSTPNLRIAIIAEAPQSTRKLAWPRSTRKQVLKRPPEPNASPEPRNFSRIAGHRSRAGRKPCVSWSTSSGPQRPTFAHCRPIERVQETFRYLDLSGYYSVRPTDEVSRGRPDAFRSDRMFG